MSEVVAAPGECSRTRAGASVGSGELVVLKFGGTSVGTPRRVRRAARRVRRHVRRGERVVVVVSAAGQSTDRILRWHGAVARGGEATGALARERDRALATGEDLSAAMLASALLALGIPARSLRGGEAGLEAAGDFGAGWLQRLAGSTLLELLDEGVVPVVSGFQAARLDGETVTLGRGGSDTSAVFLAGALGAEVCHIVTDVDSVYDRDPRLHADARRIERISHEGLVALTEGGAQVVHPAAARFAGRFGTTLRVYGFDAPLHRPAGTWVVPSRRSARPAAAPPPPRPLTAERGVARPGGSFPLELGGALEACRIGYTLYGDRRLPLVVALGGISAGRHLAAHADEPRAGWWQEFVGPGRAVDTDCFCVLGLDFLGGSGASTTACGPDSPLITTGDQARALAATLDHLGIARAHAVVGSSYGGMVGLAFGALFPGRVMRLVAISAAHESHPMATALRTLQRRVVRLGLESGRDHDALSIARGIAMTTYRTAEEFADRFAAASSPGDAVPRFPVEDYLENRGEAFAESFSPWTFLRLSESIDLHRVDPARIVVPTTLIGIEGDALVPPWQLRALASSLVGPANLVELRSIYGHDAFLKEVGAVSRVVRDALSIGGES